MHTMSYPFGFCFFGLRSSPQSRCVWHAQIRAEFEARRNDDAVRRRFDPREHQKAVDTRNNLAASTAESFLKVLLEYNLARSLGEVQHIGRACENGISSGPSGT